MQADSINILPDTTLQAGVLIEQTDSMVNLQGEEHFGLVLQAPVSGRDGLDRPETPASASWIASILMLIFVIIGLRFRSNYKFMAAIMTDITDSGKRQSIFGETVKETFYMLALNILWVISFGVLLYIGVDLTITSNLSPTAGMGIAISCVGVYAMVEWIVYWICGNVFSTGRLTKVWLSGLRASQGLASLILLPLALSAMYIPSASVALLWVAGIFYGAIRLMFVWQGFNIFFNRIGGIVPFFYYLCALEIAPLFMVYHAACNLCKAIG